MPNYKLYYFPGKGRAESARMMFKLKDVPFEDIRLEGEKWQEFKPKTPFGQMPVLEVDGKLLSQGRAIERYIAKILGLYGKDEWEAALIDMMVETCEDIFKGLLPAFGKAEEEKAAIFKTFIDEKAPTILEKTENFLKMQGTGFCVGTQLTWADIQFLTTFDLCEAMGAKMPLDAGKHPIIHEMLGNVKENPKIKEWMATRPQTKF